MAVKRIAMQRLHANHEIVTIGNSNTNLDPKFVLPVRFPLADAFWPSPGLVDTGLGCKFKIGRLVFSRAFVAQR